MGLIYLAYYKFDLIAVMKFSINFFLTQKMLIEHPQQLNQM